jgi:NTP pyrophosphatase (non-canonical NTP hydrolase)
VKHLDSIVAEFNRASSIYPAFNSAHEGYAVLLEEVEELWDEVKKSPKKRDLSKIREEAVQVAVMALRFLHDVVGES